MGLISINYETVKEKYLIESNQIMKLLRKGKSKEKNSLPEELEWQIHWAEQIEYMSLSDILDNKTMLQKPRRERVSAWLEGKKGHWVGQSEIFKEIPDELLAILIMDELKK